MVEKNSSRHTLNCCSYCRWKFPIDFLKNDFCNLFNFLFKCFEISNPTNDVEYRYD